MNFESLVVRNKETDIEEKLTVRQIGDFIFNSLYSTEYGDQANRNKYQNWETWTKESNK